MTSPDLSFPWGFDSSFSFGPDGRCSGHFGLNVLRRLISGIDDFNAAKARERRFRILGSALLGAFMWLDDPELIQKISEFPFACVVITKQGRDRHQQARLSKLQPLIQHKRGFPATALPELQFLVRHEGGETPVAGPYSAEPDIRLPALRAIGYRKTGSGLVPILHTKMVILGEVWWHDEDEFGTADVVGFRPQRLWVASANGTASSRRNLEFGFWLHEPELLRQATSFLTQVLKHSEEFDPDTDALEPELVEPSYDDIAFAEAAAAEWANPEDWRDET